LDAFADETRVKMHKYETEQIEVRISVPRKILFVPD
jgi:hypothetical protein